VGVGAKPGFTRHAQEVILDKNITLIDCPGIIFSTDLSESDAALRNCLNLDQLSDFTLPVQAILNRCSLAHIAQIYKIPNFNDIHEFLRNVAVKRGKIKQGGVVDIESSARLVIQDWNSGKIPYYTIPPEPETVHLGTSIMSQWSAQFKLSDVVEMEKQVLSVVNNDDSNFAFASAMKPSVTNPDVLFMDLTKEVDDDDDATDKVQDSDILRDHEDVSTNKTEIMTALASVKEKQEPPKKRTKLDHLNIDQQSTQLRNQFKELQREKKAC